MQRGWRSMARVQPVLLRRRLRLLPRLEDAAEDHQGLRICPQG